MTEATTTKTTHTDAGAEFAAALSLWRTCVAVAATEQVDLSERYRGIDQLMREVMRIGRLFERWACDHIEFEELDEVWPYLLEDRFGEACLRVLPVGSLDQFDEAACLRVAYQLALPMKAAS